MQRPISRRAWITALASSAGALAAACAPGGGATEITTPEGKVLQWEGDDLVVLVSGVKPQYRVGETIRLTVLVNNQTTRLAQVRVRTRLLGLGDQAVAEAEVAMLDVKPEGASSTDREVPLGRSLPPGSYTISVELPPWKLDGREAGRGVTLRSPVRIDPAG